ncbi:MAG: DUF1631 family protein [Burkholderiales bacterium]|nr:DUF1631 family protein [Burkholderiales bacterium]
MTAETSAPPRAPARSVLSECREIARSRLADVVAQALAKIDEDLFQLADKSIKRDEQQVYLDAMTRVRQHRADIQAKFEECFRTIYDQRLDTGRGEGRAAKPSALGTGGGLELALVSDSIIETGIAIDRLAKTVKNAADNNEMLGIRARLGLLLNRDSLEDADNPLAPEAIFEALKLACNHIPADDAVKQALLTAFQPYLSQSITQIYHAVNESLLAHHILPKIRHSVRQTADPMGVSQRMMGLSATQRMQALSQSGRLSQLDPASAERSGWLGGSMGNEAVGIASLLAGMAQGHAAARAEGLRMLADPAAWGGAANQAQASTDLLDALARVQTEANLGASAGVLAPGFLRNLDRSLVAQGTPLDQLTIELVTIVFDYLHADAKIAEAVKGLIARLQIVAVKAALLDRSFFASRQHPMRRLLDRMAEAGADPAVNRADDGDFMRGVRHVVDDLAVRFKDDIAVFETALAEIDALVRREHDRADALARVEAEALAAQEARAAAEAAVRADLAGRIGERTPEFVKAFLVGPWMAALVDAHLRGLTGDDSVAMRLNLAADLIWSVEPKGRADIPVLAGMLPRLVRGLMRGAIGSGLPEAERQAFFNALMQAHTEAIAAAKVAPAEIGSRPVPSQADAAPQLRPVPLMTARDAFDHAALALSKGVKVRFADPAGSETHTLTWVSPKRTFFLFTNGTKMRQLGASALGAMLRDGSAAIVDAEALPVDRALEALAAAPAPAQLAA